MLCARAAVRMWGGHLLPERGAWEIIYLVSYGFVFPCVNIWEVQLMFCAQPRQLQPSAQPPPPSPLMQISPSPSVRCVKGETCIKPTLRNTASAARSPRPPRSRPVGLEVLVGLVWGSPT